MGTVYSKQERVVTSGANELVSIPFPSRCKIHRISVVRIGGGAIDIDVFSRNLVSDAIEIERIEETPGESTTRIWLEPGVELPSLLNDTIAVAGASVGGYNTDHKVLGFGTTYRTPHPTGNLKDQQNYIDTDVTHTADATGGTATRAIPTAEEALWTVMSAIAGTANATVLTNAAYDPIEFVNRDPIGSRNIGINRAMYLRPATAATYIIDYMTEDMVG